MDNEKSIPAIPVAIENEEMIAFILRYLVTFVPGFKETLDQFVKNKRDLIIAEQEKEEWD